MNATAIATPNPNARLASAAIAAVLLASILFVVITHDTGFWQLAAFGLGPDLALIYGASAGLQKGQLHPRAVPLYNLLHRYSLPLGLLIVTAFGLLPFGYVVGGLTWCFHISLDRAVGYGLRTRDGFQRP